MNTEAKCTCEWCQKFSPLCEKISFLLVNEEESKIFHEMINNMIMAETDAAYWKEKYYGTWPGDGIEEIQHHIKRLTDRIKELENQRDYKNR